MAGKQIVEKNGEYVFYDYTPGVLTSPVVVGSVIKGASHIVGYNTGALKICCNSISIVSTISFPLVPSSISLYSVPMT